jgi:fructose-1,6-bisphosphatase/inositol monophosphatase family enzyme
MAPQIDPEKVSAIIRECAATYVLPRYKQLQAGDVSTKTGPSDLVTIADKESEKGMEERLLKLYPGSIIIGEEGVSEGRTDTKALADKDKLIWVVDPVDGTYNFVHGKREFGMLLACVVNGEIRHGWLYDILGDSMTVAEKGAGAFRDGVRIKTAAPKADLKDMIGHAGVKYFPPVLRDNIKDLRTKTGSLHTLSCACHEYLRLASGQSDFGIYSKIRPWDHLAGVLAVREAGGFVAKWDGKPYGPSDEFGGICVAGSKQVWDIVNNAAIRKMVTDYKKTL